MIQIPLPINTSSV